LQTHNCGGSFVCENTPGSFRCRPKLKCITGFTQDPHGNINECSGRTDPCSPGSHCINTVGSYTCQKKRITCSRGYHANAQGDACVVDECQVGSHHCGAAQICHNVPGSYRCECQTGYQYDALRKICNVDECWRFPGRLCSQSCENIPGSYRCSCTSGFSLAPDGKNCEVNECEKNPCSQECANVYGSYQCYCRPGYHLKQDGHTCELDECSQSMGNLCAFQCVNVVGSYRCACPPHGYVMAANGHTVDECTTGSHNCSVRQSCFNLQGGFRCLSFDCPPNYNKLSRQLSGLSQLPAAHHLLPAQLPDKHHRAGADLQDRPVSHLRRPHRYQDHQGQRRGLFQHPQTQQSHGSGVHPEGGHRATGLPHRRGDEAAETRHVHLVSVQNLRLHHIEPHV
uniref:EGF-like domain-containing protein n=1 Tax=Periophthalmus magnuspinnatus TaxID=409849 RepID=A0A3B4A749_9GOBI